ncbi:hypothetical protein D3C85_1019070 [compost metagenome]
MNTTWKPQTKKPSDSSQKPEWEQASLSASRRVCSCPRVGKGRSFKKPTSGTISATSKPSASNAADQPSQPIRPRVPGSMANWPKEPAALAMPMAMLRFSAGTARPTTPRITENEVPERPIPINSPALNDSDQAESDNPISTRPTAYNTPPIATTLAAPRRSARAPVNGWARPQIRFCKAMAKANTSRPQPNSALMGARNRPKPCRTPRDNARISALPRRIQPLVRHTDVIAYSPWQSDVRVYTRLTAKQKMLIPIAQASQTRRRAARCRPFPVVAVALAPRPARLPAGAAALGL